MRSKFKWIFTLILALTVQFSFAQEKTITGVVSDSNGPLPGVNVVVKGTTRGVQTGFDGSYSIKAKEGETLVYSFLGMREISKVVGSSSTINTVLQDDSKVLGEVVVKALGVKSSSKSLGYADQTLKGSALTEARESNISNALSGKIAGVQVTSSSGSVGASSRIVLRGVSSLTGSNDPLFVVDGIPFDNTSFGNADSGGGRDLPNGIASINPDDIESVTVLKGPSAAALYGLRASKGVIVITTKSGKSQKNFGVTFNSNMTFSNPLILPKFQNSYGQGATSDYFEYVDGAGGGYNDGVDESWGPQLDSGLEFVQWDSYKVGGAPLPWVSHKNNVKDFYNTGTSLSNSLSITGGNDAATFRLSAGNSEDNGMVPNTDLRKINITGNGSLKLGKKLTAGLNFGYYNDRSKNLPTVGYNSLNVVQQFIWSARNVNFSDLRDWKNLPLAPSNTAAAGTPLNWNNNFQNNPYWVLDTNLNSYDRDRVTGALNLGYAFTNNFRWTGKVSLDNYDQYETFRIAKGTNSIADGSYQEITRRYKEINSEMIFSFNHKITDDVTFNLNAGGNQLTRRTHALNGFITALELPNLYTLSNFKSGTTPNVTKRNTEEKINSLFGFGQVAFKNFFFIDFTARNDWASVLPKENNSFFYPSVTGSLVLSEIFGLKDVGIDLLKVRGGWAKVGSLGQITPYKINTTYQLQSNGAWGNQAFIPNDIFNPKAEPEETIGTEFGLDLNAFDGRLRLAATYYDQRNVNLLLNIPITQATGSTSKWTNGSEMTNKGIELTLGATVLKAKDFSLDVDLNFAKNENEVISLDGADSQIVGGQWGMRLENRVGHAFGDIVGRDFMRTPDGKVIYENGLPKIDNTYKVLGNVTPDWTGGANFTVKYKNFDLNTLVDAKIGGDIHSMTYSWGRYAGTLEETLIGREGGVVGNGVMSDGNGGYVPNNVVVSAKEFNQRSYSNNVESSSVFDASYVKLRQIVLGYSFPKKWLKGSFIEELKVSAVGRNLAILYKKAPHIDPETGFSSSSSEQGQEFGQLPSARNIGFNVNVKF